MCLWSSVCVLWGLVTGECLEMCNCLATFGKTPVSWFICSIPDIDPEYIILYLLVNYVTLIIHKSLWYLLELNCVSWAVFSCNSGHLSIFFTWNRQNYISKIWFQSKDSYCFWHFRSDSKSWQVEESILTVNIWQGEQILFKRKTTQIESPGIQHQNNTMMHFYILAGSCFFHNINTATY